MYTICVQMTPSTSSSDMHVVHHTPKMSARLYDVGTLLYYNKSGRCSLRTQVNLADHPLRSKQTLSSGP